MPTFTEIVRRLERIRQRLRRRYGAPVRPAIPSPVEQAVRTILAEEAAAAEVDAAMERLRRHFVDMNDLRVSRPREIRDALGSDFPRSAQKARVIPRLLDQVFKQHNSMVWDFLESMGKVEARAYFEKLEDVRPFVAAVLARDWAGAHAFPVDSDVARVLGRLGIVDPAVQSESEMQALLERAVKSNRVYDVHALVKRLGEELCIADTPLCGRCPLNPMCPSAVCPPRGRGPRKAKPSRTAKRAAKRRKSVRKKAGRTARRK